MKMTIPCDKPDIFNCQYVKRTGLTTVFIYHACNSNSTEENSQATSKTIYLAYLFEPYISSTLVVKIWFKGDVSQSSLMSLNLPQHNAICCIIVNLHVKVCLTIAATLKFLKRLDDLQIIAAVQDCS